MLQILKLYLTWFFEPARSFSAIFSARAGLAEEPHRIAFLDTSLLKGDTSPLQALSRLGFKITAVKMD